MPPHTPYRSSKSRRRRRNPFPWLLLLLALVAGTWIWWQSGKLVSVTEAAPTSSPAPPQARSPQTNIVASPKVQSLPRPQTNAASVKTQINTNPVARPPAAVTPSSPPQDFPRPVGDAFEAQLALARQSLSPGSLDGVMGAQTRAALAAFQRKNGLPETGSLDDTTRAALLLTTPPLTSCTVTSNDLARLQPLSKTWLGKSQQTALDYETILELAAEKGRASPNLIRRLNPGIDWASVVVGTQIQIPDVTNAPPATKAAFAVISLSEKKLQAFDEGTNVLAHFPCSIAARFDKRPVGELHVVAIAENPNYTFNPEVFPESAEARLINTKLILPPGPNNPVGTAWISLDKPGYGIHGTPSPEQVGRTESHGCFRLANWNADYFLKLAWIGMPVYVEP